MTKGDWIRVVESLFTEVKLDRDFNAVKGVLDDENYGDFGKNRRNSHPFPVIPNSRVFTMDKLRAEDRTITVLAKNLVDEGSPHLFWGDYLIIEPSLETCIVSSRSSMSAIPWDEVSVITTAEY